MDRPVGSRAGIVRLRLSVTDLADRDLLRSLGRRLAEEGPEGSRLHATMSQSIAGEPKTSRPGALHASRNPFARAQGPHSTNSASISSNRSVNRWLAV